MTETQANKAAAKLSRETGKACKVIHTGGGQYMAVIVGSAQHKLSKAH